jgi:hypothetical protein
MKHPNIVRLDFVAPVHEARKTGLALVVLGVLSILVLGFAFNAKLTQRDQLEARLDAVPRAKRSAPISDPKLTAELAAIKHELNVPWTPVLNELEAANHDLADSVAVLSVVPDAEKHTVRVVAEVRQLPDALRYLERLQKSALLRYPMLESHERRKDDPEHPIRIKLSAEWRS